MKNKTPISHEDAFIREVNEDLKNDQLLRFWKKYGLHIIIFMIVVLTTVVSYESIKAWKTKQNQEWSDTYAYAIALQSQGKYEESLKVLDKMQSSGSNIYSDIAKIQISNVLFEQGKNDDAIKYLEKIVKDGSVNKQMHDVAVVKLASYKLDTAPAEDVIDLLTPLINEKGTWSDIAKEMLAMLYIREGNFAQAKAVYNDILNTPNIDDGLAQRVRDMLSVLDDDKSK